MDHGQPHEPHGQGPTDHPDDEPETASGAGARLDFRGLRRWARFRGWKLPITDGPFAESKELLGG